MSLKHFGPLPDFVKQTDKNLMDVKCLNFFFTAQLRYLSETSLNI